VIGEEAELIKYLSQFTRVVSHNGDRFDFEVLRKYENEETEGKIDFILKNTSWDLLRQIQKAAGHRVSLEQVGEALPNPTPKLADGLLAVKWWRGKDFDERMKGFEYCKGDTKILVDVVKNLMKTGKVGFVSRNGDKEVELKWE
jgi:uncharacterized protein YprB with RNaseH-like and TPR domain